MAQATENIETLPETFRKLPPRAQMLSSLRDPDGTTRDTLLDFSELSHDDAGMMMRQIVDDRLYAHFITFSCDRRRRLLSLDQPKRLIGALNQELRRIDAKCIGFVIMPDHVHAVVWFPRPSCFSGFMHEWKRYSSRMIREWYRESKPAMFRQS